MRKVYALLGFIWALFAVRQQVVRGYPRTTKHLIMCFVLNLVFMPAAILIAAFKEIKDVK